MAVDCTDTIAVRTAVCNNATDIQEMITLPDDGTLTTNYGAKPISLIVKEKLINDLQALGITYVWTYVWADITARNAQVGMATDEYGYQTDTDTMYQYDGALWQVSAPSTDEQSYNTVTSEVFKYDGANWILFYTLASATDVINNTANIATNVTNIAFNAKKDDSITIDMTADADQVLTAAQIPYGRIEITDIGTPITAQRKITLDNLEHTFLFVNNADFPLEVIALGGTGIVVANGEAKELRNDTVDVIEFEAAVENNKIHLQEQQTSGVNAGSSSAGLQARLLNTEISNTIAGASHNVGTGVTTLPAGDYEVRAIAGAFRPDAHRISIYDNTGAAILVLGKSAYSQSAFDVLTDATIDDAFTLAVTSDVILNHHITTARATNGLGVTSTDGNTNNFAAVIYKKVG